jgi:membrane associated rhomboid family serine protease
MHEVTAETVLRLCGEAAPKPWFPSVYAKSEGVNRDEFDDPLAALRLAGLVRIADWEPGAGQGYVITENGRVLLESPRALARLRQTGSAAPAADRDTDDIRGTPWERGETVREALIDLSLRPATIALMVAQVVVFGVGFAFAQQRGISLKDYLERGISPTIGWLGLSGTALAVGQWWRLITYCFVHGGAIHLILNLVGHRSFGPPVERMFGPWVFLAIWFVSGIGGGAAAVYANPAGVTVGSSGALCGVVAALAIGILLNREHLGSQLFAAWRQVLMQVIVLTVLISFVPHVSASGHLGGALVGMVAGALGHCVRFGVRWQRWAGVAGIVALPVVCVVLLQNYGREPREESDFSLRIRPLVSHVAERTETIRKNLLPLVETPVAQRDAESIREARDEIIPKLRPELNALLKLVEAAGPYQTARIEDARQTALKYIEVQQQLTDQIERAIVTKDREVAERHSVELILTEYRIARRQWQGLFK